MRQLYQIKHIHIKSLQENVLLVTNFSDQKLLVTILNNLDTNLQSKKLLVTKIVTIMNKKLYLVTKLVFKISYHDFGYQRKLVTKS